MRILVIFLFIVSCFDVQAKNLGAIGSTYPIQEQSILEWILQKLNKMEESGDLERFQDDFKNKVLASILRPTPVTGISHASEKKEFFYDPSITLSEAILTHDGKTIHPAGTKVNPLDTVKFNQTFLFIDGDDESHVRWALEQPADEKKIILVSGPIIDLMKEHHIRLYFDQKGKLTSQFGITHVPAQVAQFGKRFRVKEVVI